ncbi:uncharacterized protein LOC119668523 [Teleopsis dalmanni]|uniref:uncharacterized protein LOC119668523 n=1 Tax=Teleopsis dalmanni TaxID=139649 RepID=UPI0018CDA087|nr:uncharacterized protein LOC119668523 [Teleopsis dalmanni]
MNSNNVKYNKIINNTAGRSAYLNSVTSDNQASYSSKIPTAYSNRNERESRVRSRRSGANSRKIYNDRRAANRLVERFNNTPYNQLSEANKCSLDWARKVLETAPSTDKRESGTKRSIVESVSTPEVKNVQFSGNSTQNRPLLDQPNSNSEAKKAKCSNPIQNEPLSDIVKSQITIAVIDDSDPDGKITHENWSLINKKLMDLYLDLMKEYPGKTPSFRDGGWFQGYVKLIDCADQRSVDIYRIAISRLGEVWPGAKLRVVDKDQIPCRPRAHTWVPAEPSDPRKILNLIQLGNWGIGAHTWRITKVEEPKGRYRWVNLVLDKASLVPLARSGGVINYGFSSINIKVYKKDQERS